MPYTPFSNHLTPKSFAGLLCFAGSLSLRMWASFFQRLINCFTVSLQQLLQIKPLDYLTLDPAVTVHQTTRILATRARDLLVLSRLSTARMLCRATVLRWGLVAAHVGLLQ